MIFIWSSQPRMEDEVLLTERGVRYNNRQRRAFRAKIRWRISRTFPAPLPNTTTRPLPPARAARSAQCRKSAVIRGPPARTHATRSDSNQAYAQGATCSAARTEPPSPPLALRWNTSPAGAGEFARGACLSCARARAATLARDDHV